MITQEELIELLFLLQRAYAFQCTIHSSCLLRLSIIKVCEKIKLEMYS